MGMIQIGEALPFYFSIMPPTITALKLSWQLINSIFQQFFWGPINTKWHLLKKYLDLLNQKISMWNKKLLVPGIYILLFIHSLI